MISEKKRLQIENICYANVAGMFAMFTNPRYRGRNFTWEWFVTHCEKDAPAWMVLSDITGNKKAEFASQFARDIAQRLVNEAK